MVVKIAIDAAPINSPKTPRSTTLRARKSAFERL